MSTLVRAKYSGCRSPYSAATSTSWSSADRLTCKLSGGAVVAPVGGLGLLASPRTEQWHATFLGESCP